MYVDRTHLLLEGLRKLKNAALLYIIASILVGFSALTAQMLRGVTLMSILVLGVAGGILALVSLFVFLIPGFNRLSEYDQRLFKTPRNLILVGLPAGYILFMVGLGLASLALVALSIPLLLISILLLLIGYIGFLMGLFRLKDLTGENMFKVAGILFVIGVFLRGLAFIGWIALYVGARRTLKKYEAPGRPPPAAASPTVMVPRQ